MKAVRTRRVYKWLASAALGIALLVAIADLPDRLAATSNALPVVRLLNQPDEQYRLLLGDVPYDLLRAADAALPRDATVLLVTSGRDTGTLEYITYHRALYFLAPRPVWWAAPTPSDGTWKSRWWISTPLTTEALGAVAFGKGATHLLVFGVEEPLPLGERILEQPDGYLLQLAPSGPARASEPSTPQFAGALWPLGLLFAVAIPLALGYIMLYVVAGLGYGANGVEALSLAWALGAGLLTLAMLYLNALGVSLRWQMAVLAALAVVGLLVTGITRRRWFRQTTATRAGTAHVTESGIAPAGQYSAPSRTVEPGVQFVLWALLVLQFAMVSVSALGKPLTVWDSWVNWGVKARSIFLDGYISPAVYADASRTVTHLDYPLLVPLLESWLFAWVGAPDDRFAGVASVLFYASLSGLCYSAVRSRGGSRTLSLAAACTVATLWHLTGMAGLVLAEMPLLVFATITGIYLLKWLEGGPPGTLLLAGLGAGFLCWTKRDGILFLASIALAMVLLCWRERRAWQGLMSLLAGVLIVAGPWYLFVALNGLPSPEFASIHPSVLLANLERWSTILPLELDSLLSPLWGYIWPLAALLLVVVLGSRVRKPTRALIPLAGFLHIVVSGAVYFFSDFVPLEQHVLSSIDRLIAQAAPLVLIWIAFQAVPVTAPGAYSPTSSNVR